MSCKKVGVGADDAGCFVDEARVRASGLAVRDHGTDPGGVRDELSGSEAENGGVGGVAGGMFG